MKLNKSSQLLLVSAASLLAALLVTACSQFTQTLTVDFVYVASAKAAGANNYGEINVFEINSESGHMRQIPASPFPSAGRNPVAMAASADYSSLFVVNHDDNTLVQFVIGSDGKLYPYNTVNTPGIFPLAIAANASNLFVVDTYQPLPTCSTAYPCSGSIAVFPLSAANASTPITINPAVTNTGLSAQYWPLTLASAPSDIIVPTAVSVLPSGNYVYVTAYDSSVTPNKGYVFAFSVASNGALTPVAGSPFAAGAHPSSIASDRSGGYVYIADYARANVLSYSVTTTTGNLTAVAGSPFPAGSQPSAIVASPHYPLVYVANSLDGTVTGYSVTNGVLTFIGTYATGEQPVAIGIDPSTNRFLYTANFLGNNVSGFTLNTTSGVLLNSQFSPYASNEQPTAVAAIPHNGTGAGIK